MNNRENRRLTIYTRSCSKCDEIFKTKSRGSKVVCPICQKKNSDLAKLKRKAIIDYKRANNILSKPLMKLPIKYENIKDVAK